MRLRALMILALLGAMPALVAAQSTTEPVQPAIAVAPQLAKAPRVIATTVPAVPVSLALPAQVAIASALPHPPAVTVAPRPAVAIAMASRPTLTVPTAPRPAVVAAAPVFVDTLELPETQPPTPPAAPKAPAAVTATAPPAPPAPPRPIGQMLNVQIEVTLSDTKGTPKAVVLTVADGEMGQNRTNSASNAGTGTSYQTFSFNADARPTIVGNKIRLYLSAEANIPSSPDAKAGAAANLNLRQQQTLVLNDGDSAEIARASDPLSDRSFVLSVKVKIQR